MPSSRLAPTTVLLIAATLVGGLAVDIRTDIFGQTVMSIGVWALLLLLMSRMALDARCALMSCLVIATIGEIVLSIICGLYTYRLGNIPLFVPPGHVLLLVLGLWLADLVAESAAWAVLGCAGIYSVVVAVAGIDTLGIALFAIFAVASYMMPSQRRLYATTFVLSLALELYATWLGNWTWAAEVARLDLVTTNPPGAAGAFYCALDALAAAASLHLVPHWRAWTVRANPGRPGPAWRNPRARSAQPGD